MQTAISAKKKAKLDQIKRHARIIINTEGIARLTIRNLSQACGTSASTLYHYIESRDALALELYQETFQKLIHTINTLTPLEAHFTADSRHKLVTQLWQKMGEHYQSYNEGESCSLLEWEYCSSMPKLRPLHEQVIARIDNLGLYRDRTTQQHQWLHAYTIFGIIKTIPQAMKYESLERLISALTANSLNGLCDGYNTAEQLDKFLHETHLTELLSAEDDLIYQKGAMLFNRLGYDGMHMDMLGKSLKLSKGGIYHHVSSKDDLLKHCCLRTLHIRLFIVRMAIRQGSFEDAFIRNVNLITHPSAGIIHPSLKYYLSSENFATAIELAERLYKEWATLAKAHMAPSQIISINPIAVGILISGHISQAFDAKVRPYLKEHPEAVIDFANTLFRRNLKCL